MKSTKTKTTKAAQSEPMVRIEVAPRMKELSQSELSGLAAAQVTIQMALERLEAEFPSLWVSGIELYPCPPNCRVCKAAA